MARPSTDSLSVAAVSIPTRPEPPKDLTPYAQQIWVDTVATKPPEWFEADTFPILRAYCIAADWHKRIADKIEEDPDDTAVGKKLDVLEKQARLLATLAVKMRLTQQSRYTPMAAATANKKSAGGRKPWDA
jgi:hypothetical protein